MMAYYLTPRAGHYPFCRECPARPDCVGEKTPEDAETEEWISEVCYETAGEWSLTYGRIDEDDPSFNVPEPPEPWDEYAPDDDTGLIDPDEVRELLDGDDWDEPDAPDDYIPDPPEPDEAPIIGVIDENGNFQKRGAW